VSLVAPAGVLLLLAVTTGRPEEGGGPVVRASTIGPIDVGTMRLGERRSSGRS
jgi:hypothetical protein